MGSVECKVACCHGCAKGQPVPAQISAAEEDAEPLVCTEWSHVESLLAHLPPDVHAALEDKEFQRKCHQTFRELAKGRAPGDSYENAFLEGDDLVEAVHRCVPDQFLQERLHTNDVAKLVLAFDTNADGRIGEAEFDLFCMWAVAMDVLGFFTGTTPFAKIAKEIAANRLLIISEFLDPERVLGHCALPTTAVSYYHPDGITIDEFSAQIKAAAHVRTQQGLFFDSVALANHGPDEHGRWNVCSDHPVLLNSSDAAWPRLMPMFQALASMVSNPSRIGQVDLLACNFAANPAGLECLKMIESQVNVKFSASTDATGNVAQHGNWQLERGGRNVAPIYFHEEMLNEFTKLMAPSKVDDSVMNLMEQVVVPKLEQLHQAQAEQGQRSHRQKTKTPYDLPSPHKADEHKADAQLSHASPAAADAGACPTKCHRHAVAQARGGARGGGSACNNAKERAAANAKARRPPVRHAAAKEVEESAFTGFV